MKPTWRYYFCLFHSHDQKSKRNHQIAKSRAKTISRRNQTCVKYRVWLFVLREIQMWTQVIWIYFNKKMYKKGWFSRCYLKFLQNFMWFANVMINWSVMTVTVHLAPWSECHSLSFHCYNFCLHTILFL